MSLIFKTKRVLIKIQKGIGYFFQALFIYTFFLVLKILPVDFASWFSGRLIQFAGGFSHKNKISNANLRFIFPEKSEKEIKHITKKMWNNLGRIIGEFCHIDKFNDKYKDRIKINGREHLDELIAMNKGGIVISAHFGNWELASFIASTFGVKINIIFRKPNNYFLNPLFNMRNKKSENGIMIPKTNNTVKQILQALKNKEFLGILIDQKINSGLEMNFLNHPTKVSDSSGLFAIKTGVPIIPAIIKRTKGVNFEISILPYIIPEKTGDFHYDVEQITIKTNKIIEEWILENPEQWLWIHDRWKLNRMGLVK